jgi:murein DD-endopeptidase MepM/ murein hydrolase activator NlpD
MDQHIKRRKKNSLLFRAMSYRASPSRLPGKPAGHNGNINIIEQIKQKPARHKNIKPAGSSPGLGTSFFKGFCKFPRGEKKPKKNPPPVSASFSAPLMPLIILGGLVLFSGLVFSPQDSSLFQLFGENFFLAPQEDGEFQANLAAYAGLGSPAVPAEEAIIPLDLTETFAWESYTVKAGDSVSKIAAGRALSMDAIIASNGITNAKRLRAGDVLRIPNMDGIPYTVKKGDTLSKISAAMEVPLEAILDANNIQSDSISAGTVLFIPGARMRTEDLKLALGELFVYPIRGRITSSYGWRNDPISGVRRFHAAVDMAALTGAPVKAAMDGRVSSVGFNSIYGKYIIISHGNGYQTMYAHLSAVSVNQGAYVNQSAKIGEVGSTGYSTGPHLHFALYKNGRAVNPLDFLNS